MSLKTRLHRLEKLSQAQFDADINAIIGQMSNIELTGALVALMEADLPEVEPCRDEDFEAMQARYCRQELAEREELAFHKRELIRMHCQEATT